MTPPDILSFLQQSKPEPGIVLAPEQDQALQGIMTWFALAKTKHSASLEYKLGGYAGTGKTTLIKFLIRELHNVAVCAFTGKAADVLCRKGVPASTIHSLIYECEEDELTGELIFIRRPYLPYALIIVDEASMISTELYDDLASYRIPILFVGDPGQLEPVGDNPNLMKAEGLNFVLQTIHRQAMGNPIIELASHVRLDGTLKPYRYKLENNKGQIKFTNARVALNTFVDDVDQVICARNKTRTAYNTAYRKHKNFAQGIVKGEKLICLRNNKKLGVFNGQLWFVDEILNESASSIVVLAHDERPNAVSRELHIWSDPFYRKVEDNEKICKDWVYCDYGYCVTCHKSQGSEWKHVMLIDEWMPPEVWDMKRWRYTGITRAAERLTYACL